MTTKSSERAEGLIAVLRANLAGDDAQAFSYLVLYTSFGVVRGRTGMLFLQESATQATPGDEGYDSSPEVVEVHDAAVEHYSNHLPTATFARLHVRIDDVRGFAIVGPQGQN